MRFGIAEIVLVVFVAIALLKPEKLKEYIVALNNASKTFKETKKQIQDEAKDIVEPVMDIKKDVDDAVKGDL